MIDKCPYCLTNTPCWKHATATIVIAKKFSKLKGLIVRIFGRKNKYSNNIFDFKGKTYIFRGRLSYKKF